ncbi:MAG: DUF4040 domain-containing protein [Actinobacteria bacterium]|nr:DUF4040 domain-containing protein [Actinomycetota bacterium]
MVTQLLTFLLIFMIIAALKALMTPRLLSAAISLGAVGLGVSFVFLLLRAPDAAIPHIVVEILVLLLLIRAAIRREVKTVSGQRDIFGAAVAAVLLLLLLALIVPVFSEDLSFGAQPVWAVTNPQVELASAHYLSRGLSETGSANIVTAVLLAYRGYDTLGEATVLFAAILGALVLLRPRARKPLEEK